MLTVYTHLLCLKNYIRYFTYYGKYLFEVHRQLTKPFSFSVNIKNSF